MIEKHLQLYVYLKNFCVVLPKIEFNIRELSLKAQNTGSAEQ